MARMLLMCQAALPLKIRENEVEQLIKEALQEHIQTMSEENLPLPQSQSEAEYIDITLTA